MEEKKYPQEQSEGLGGPRLPRPSKTSLKMQYKAICYSLAYQSIGL